MNRSTTSGWLPCSEAVRRRKPSSREILLPDGLRLRLRELRREDRARLKAFLERFSSQSIRARFFSPIKQFTDALLDQLVEVDGRKRIALIVTRSAGENEDIVAEGHATALRERPWVADVALLVEDKLHRRGIATRLLNELGLVACQNGFTHFCADLLAENQAVLAIVRKTSLRPSSTISYGVIHIEAPLLCRDAAALPNAA